jgi:uncharacterized membrane protein YkvI
MHWRDIDRGELIALVGGIVLAISLFLAWYSLGNSFTQLNNCKGPNTTCTGWQSLLVLRYLILAAAISPLILIWIILRGHALSWPRGELTALIALIALTFVLFRGPISKPGAPRTAISLSFGWYVALVGALVMLFGAIYRSSEAGSQRKPPGVL